MSGAASGPVVVVGAGIAGVACARELVAAGLEVRVLDRGRRIGGRMASRRFEGPAGERPVDMGASYVTVSDDDFAAVVDDWRARGLAEPWTDRFTVLAPGADTSERVSETTGPVRWRAPRALRSLVEDLATPLTVEHAEVAGVRLDGDALLVDDRPARAVVLAMPDPQAARLVADDPALASVHDRLDRAYDPTLALVARFAERTWDEVDPSGRFEGAFVNDHPVIEWIADDGRRRGDDAPFLVVHSTAGFAAPRLADPPASGPALVAALREVLDLPEPVETRVHRWSLAKPAGEREAPYLLEHLGPASLGVCGDGWGPRPKVQTAWLSGRALGRRLAADLRA